MVIDVVTDDFFDRCRVVIELFSQSVVDVMQVQRDKDRLDEGLDCDRNFVDPVLELLQRKHRLRSCFDRQMPVDEHTNFT